MAADRHRAISGYELSVGGSGINGWFPVPSHLPALGPDPFEDLFTVHGHILRCREAEAHLEAHEARSDPGEPAIHINRGIASACCHAVGTQRLASP